MDTTYDFDSNSSLSPRSNVSEDLASSLPADEVSVNAFVESVDPFGSLAETAPASEAVVSGIEQISLEQQAPVASPFTAPAPAPVASPFTAPVASPFTASASSPFTAPAPAPAPAPVASPFTASASSPFTAPAPVASPFTAPAPVASPFTAQVVQPFAAGIPLSNQTSAPAPASPFTAPVASPFTAPVASPFTAPAPVASPFTAPVASPFAVPTSPFASTTPNPYGSSSSSSPVSPGFTTNASLVSSQPGSPVFFTGDYNLVKVPKSNVAQAQGKSMAYDLAGIVSAFGTKHGLSLFAQKMIVTKYASEFGRIVSAGENASIVEGIVKSVFSCMPPPEIFRDVRSLAHSGILSFVYLEKQKAIEHLTPYGPGFIRSPFTPWSYNAVCQGTNPYDNLVNIVRGTESANINLVRAFCYALCIVYAGKHNDNTFMHNGIPIPLYDILFTHDAVNDDKHHIEFQFDGMCGPVLSNQVFKSRCPRYEEYINTFIFYLKHVFGNQSTERLSHVTIRVRNNGVMDRIRI
jgi:hypothetical protein